MIQCTNHFNKTGNNLCIKCGKWYCDSCMQMLKPAPICKNCSIVNYPNIGIFKSFQNQFEKLPLISPIALSTIFMLILILLSFFVHFYFFLPLTVIIVIIIFLLKLKFSNTKDNTSKTITNAQVETLLKITNNYLTIDELSEKTQVTFEDAEKKLLEMYLDSKLEMEESEGIIYYFKQ